MDTKKRIIAESIRLFNECGIVNVRLQSIADEANISVGNLAYHFCSKEAIIKSIVNQLADLLYPMTDKKEFPILIDFDTQLAKYYHILIKYSFFFIDLLEIKRNYPKQYSKRILISERTSSQIYDWIKQNVKKGILISEPRSNHYKIIAHTIWMIITFYLTKPLDQSSLTSGERVFKEMIWTQILPYFTPTGRLEFDLLIESLLNPFVPKNQRWGAYALSG